MSRGCPKPLGDEALRDPSIPTTCPVLEIEGWYWRAVEDSLMLGRGHATAHDFTAEEYRTALEVETARAGAERQQAKIQALRAEMEAERSKGRR